MKKIALIFMTIVFLTGLGLAQDATTTKLLKANTTIWEDFSGDVSMSSTQDTVDFVVKFNKAYPVQYDLYAELDSTSGTPGIKIELLGKVWDEEASWTSITSTTWAGSTSDTTFHINSQGNQSYVVTLTGTDTIASVDSTIMSAAILMDTTAFAFNDGGDRDSTVLYSGTLIDTLLTARSVTGANTQTGTMTYTDITVYYRRFMIRVTRSAGVGVVDYLAFKIWERQY